MYYEILSKDKKITKFNLFLGKTGSDFYRHNFVIRCDSYTDRNICYVSGELSFLNYGITLFWVV